MGKNFTTAFALCLAISALPLACGDDEDDDGGNSKGGKGGSGANGGSAGSSTGGRGGSAGSGTTGGRGGTAGQGGTTGGSAGSATGGMGGAEGGMGGDDPGGMGGEGGQVEPPMSICEQVCDGPATTCMPTCIADYCEVYYTNAAGTPACEPLLDAMLLCQAAGDDANWMCTQGNPGYSGQECQDEVDAAYGAGCF